MKRNGYYVLFLLMCLAGGEVLSQNAQFKWIELIQLYNTDAQAYHKNHDIEIDEDGNVYIIGNFSSQARWMDDSMIDTIFDTCGWLADNTFIGGYIAKLDSNGNRLWVKVLRTTLRTGEHSGVWLTMSNITRKDSLLYFSVDIAGGISWREFQQHVPIFWFFDTLYQYPVQYPESQYGEMPDSLMRFPFYKGNSTAFVAFFTMDLDGNIVDRHHITLHSDSIKVYSGDTIQTVFSREYLNMDHIFTVDSKKNIHFFPEVRDPFLLQIDDDSTKLMDMNPWEYNIFNLNYCFHIIIDSNWNITSARPIISSVDSQGIFILPRWITNHAVRLLPLSLTLDDEDNVYLRVRCTTHVYSVWLGWKMGLTYYDPYNYNIRYPYPYPEVEYPYYIYLDSVHRITVENVQAGGEIDAVIKYDTAGNVVWCNQIYECRPDTNSIGYDPAVYSTPVAFDSANVYVLFQVRDQWKKKQEIDSSILYEGYHRTIPDTNVPTHFYFDEEHRHELIMPPFDEPDWDFYHHGIEYERNYRWCLLFNYYAVYDRQTGEFKRYVQPWKREIDSIKAFFVWSYVDSHELVFNNGKPLRTYGVSVWGPRGLGEHPEPPLFVEHDLQTNEVKVIDSLMVGMGNNTVLHKNGLLYDFSEYEQCRPPAPFNPNYYYLYRDAPMLTCFYLPGYDSRILPPCPKVDSLTVSYPGMSTALLAWHPDSAHQAWLVEQLPVRSIDSVPDSADWEQALVTEVTDPSLTIDLDTCLWLRVRGICSTASGHASDWSEPVAACPQVGIPPKATTPYAVLSPNPASGTVTVTDAWSGTPIQYVKSLEVYSSLGRKVMHHSGNGVFNVGNLPAGTYMVKVVTWQGTQLLKLVVE